MEIMACRRSCRLGKRAHHRFRILILVTFRGSFEASFNAMFSGYVLGPYCEIPVRVIHTKGRKYFSSRAFPVLPSCLAVPRSPPWSPDDQGPKLP